MPSIPFRNSFESLFKKYCFEFHFLLTAFSFLLGPVKGLNFRKRIFVPFFENFYDQYAIKYLPFVSTIFDNLRDEENNGKRILEIGIRSGFNLPFYPENCSLIGIEQNEYFEEGLSMNLENYPGITLEKLYLNENYEDLNDIESESVDFVVNTLSQCTVTDNEKAFREILRVLSPGGKYIFIEHILDGIGGHDDNNNKDGIRRRIQLLMNRLGFWTSSFEGCRFNEDYSKLLNKIGFSQVKLDKAEIDFESSKFGLLSLVNPHLIGFATK